MWRAASLTAEQRRKISEEPRKQITDEARKGHQFKGNPAAELGIIPRSMSERAKDGGQWPDIIAFMAKTRSPAQWKERMGLVSPKFKGQVRRHAERHADTSAFTPEIPDILANPDEVWLSVTKAANGQRSMTYILRKYINDRKSIRIGTRQNQIKTYFVEKVSQWEEFKNEVRPRRLY